MGCEVHLSQGLSCFYEEGLKSPQIVGANTVLHIACRTDQFSALKRKGLGEFLLNPNDESLNPNRAFYSSQERVSLYETEEKPPLLQVPKIDACAMRLSYFQTGTKPLFPASIQS